MDNDRDSQYSRPNNILGYLKRAYSTAKTATLAGILAGITACAGVNKGDDALSLMINQEATVEQQEAPQEKAYYGETQKEKDLEEKGNKAYYQAVDLYEKVVDQNTNPDEAKDLREQSLEGFLRARALYVEAERANPNNTVYGEVVDAANKNIAVAMYDTKLSDLTPEQRTAYNERVRNYRLPQEPKPEDPKPQDTVPAEPKPVEPTVPPGPFETTRLSLDGAVGPYARHAGGNVRLGPLEVLAEFDKNRLETSSGDDVTKKRMGIYAKADVGFFKAWAAGVMHEDELKSRSYEEIDTALSNLKTTTTLDQLTETEDFRIGGALQLWDTELFATLCKLEEDIGVDVATDLVYTDKNNPSGSYTDRISTNQSFLNETLGMQGGFNHSVNDKVKFGMAYTGELIDMPDFNREIDLHRAHGNLQYRGKNVGGNAIVGQGLLKDNGERLTRGEYGAVAGIGNDYAILTGKFSRVEDPKGSARLILGNNNDVLPYVLDNDAEKIQSEMRLFKQLPDGLQESYFRNRNQDLLVWLARKGDWMILAEGGMTEFDRNGKEERPYQWDVALIAPIFKDVTLTGRSYRHEDVYGKTDGVEVGILPRNSGWNLFITGEVEELPGFGEKDKRALVGLYLTDVLKALKGE